MQGEVVAAVVVAVGVFVDVAAAAAKVGAAQAVGDLGRVLVGAGATEFDRCVARSGDDAPGG